MAVARPREVVALDSNFLVAARASGSKQGRQLEEWLAAGVSVEISAVAWSEYLCGPVDERDVEIARSILSRIDPFLEGDAQLASELFNQTGRRSRSHVDCMIAAHTIRRDGLLATLNIQDFRRFEKFQLRLVRI